MNLDFTTGYRHPRESGVQSLPWLEQGATAAALPLLASRFRGNDDKERRRAYHEPGRIFRTNAVRCAAPAAMKAAS
jgi:hypothetical protein